MITKNRRVHTVRKSEDLERAYHRTKREQSNKNLKGCRISK